MWTVINFSVWECLQKLSRVSLEESIRKKLGSRFFFSPTRREGKKRAETLTDLIFPSDGDILEIIKEARSDAQGMLASLGVHSGVPTVFSSIPEVEPIDSDHESDDEVLFDSAFTLIRRQKMAQGHCRGIRPRAPGWKATFLAPPGLLSCRLTAG